MWKTDKIEKPCENVGKKKKKKRAGECSMSDVSLWDETETRTALVK